MSDRSKRVKASELFRERIVLRYYGAFKDIPTADIDILDPSVASTHGFVPQSSTDTALTAFAQLGALRLDASRAFISLIDSDNQYILAEATRTLSTQLDSRHDLTDSLWLGTIVIPRDNGVCGMALESGLSVAVGEDDITVITDLREHPRCAGAVFLDSGPQLRFYAGAPIRTAEGAVIGVYCVFDDKLRPGLTDDQKVFLRDMAKTTMEHLDSVRLRNEHMRKTRLVNGLESFIDGLTAIRTPQEEARNQHNPDVETAKELAMQDVAAEPSIPRPKRSDDDTGTVGTAHKSLWELAMPSGSMPMLSRAANIIRQSGDYDGVAFFYLASTSSHKGQRSRRQSFRSELPNPGSSRPTSTYGKDSSMPLHSEGSSDSLEKLFNGSDAEESSGVERKSPSSPCPLLSYSLASSASASTNSSGRARFSRFKQRDMDRLIGKGPRARTFTLNRAGEVLPGDTSSSGSGAEQIVPIIDGEKPGGTLPTDASRLRRLNMQRKQIRSLQKLCPTALSYLCLPLWDSERQRWLAYCICWSTSPSRHLKQDGDLTFLRIFGNSIGIALSHIDALASSKAKSTFVSSMSHELRSPLHGVLSATSFLNDSELSRFQREMVNVISNCGRTLLDTVDHVMDFAKISSLVTKPRKRSSADSGLTSTQSADEQLTSTVDLSLLLEEVVEAVVMGFQSQEDFVWTDEDPRANFHRMPSFNSRANSVAHSQRALTSRGRVRLIVQLSHRSNWWVTTQVGAWRRIIMNLFGNSLKYTSDGMVMIRIQSEAGGNPSISVSLDVVDTGKGMSKQYMDTRLYTPFSQEDEFASGTGLGLSIVHQIVQALGGTIDISSSPGIGTKTRVIISVLAASPPPRVLDSPTTFEGYADRLRGRRVYVLENASTEPSADLAASTLQRAELEFSSTLSNTLRDWLGMNVLVGTSWPTEDVDLVVCLKPGVRYLDQSIETAVRTPILLIAHDALEMAVLQADSRVAREDTVVEFISQPLGPHKLARIVDQCLERQAGLTAHQTKELGNSTSWQNRLPMPRSSSSPGPQPSAYDDELRCTSAELIREPFVLIVDDNKVNLRLLSMFFKKLSLKYYEASNGQEAVDIYAAAARSVRYIIMDISMPVMDGITATRRIREIQQHGKHPKIAIVALTGLTSAAARNEAQEAGMDMFITKPISFDQLRNVLTKVQNNYEGGSSMLLMRERARS